MVGKMVKDMFNKPQPTYIEKKNIQTSLVPDLKTLLAYKRRVRGTRSGNSMYWLDVVLYWQTLD